MAYVEQVLEPDERVRFRTSLHGSLYVPGGLALASGLTFLFLHYLNGKANLLLLLAALVLGATGLVLTAAAWLRRLGTEIAVTDRRVICKSGLLRRHTVEMNLDKVESVDVDQSLPGRLFGYGTVTIRGTGQAIAPLPDVAEPIRFRTAILVR